MADLTISNKPGRRKTHSSRVDLTPMVDLGFLLITFFMMTTTLAKPKVMELNMPVKSDEPTIFREESTITLIPVSDHKVVYYNGTATSATQLSTAAIDNIRAILVNKKKLVSELPANLSAQAHQLHVLIKPNDNCKYEDLVRLLDEMNILAVSYYAIVDVTDDEKAWIEKNPANFMENK